MTKELAIQILRGEVLGTNEQTYEAVFMAIKALKNEPKRGKWIKMSDADGVYWACSECGEDIPRVSDFNPQFDLFPRLKSIDKTNYCPHCGAKMESDRE